MKDAIQEMAKKLFHEVQANDDRLGAYSDYEGTSDGPTMYFWGLGYSRFKRQCTRAIRDHNTAIETMKKLQKLNEKRRK